MKILIKYNKNKPCFIIKINKRVLFTHRIKKLNKDNLFINISLVIYNYILVLKILRQYGLIKPLKNFIDYIS